MTNEERRRLIQGHRELLGAKLAKQVDKACRSGIEADIGACRRTHRRLDSLNYLETIASLATSSHEGSVPGASPP